MRYLIQIVMSADSSSKYGTYSFKVKSTKHMYYLIYEIYKICYNDIELIKVINLKNYNTKLITTNFYNIKLEGTI